jgi:ring-1,2-phenylacetyl-CoA epoxidase subunit PaaC
MPASLVTALIGLADDHLILGHRLSEWCGHAPMLEEDLAMPNIALDLIGQARALYSYAGELEGAGRDEDALAFGRLERAYRNLLICELPNGDFAHTMLRQFYFASFMQLFWQAAEQVSGCHSCGDCGQGRERGRVSPPPLCAMGDPSGRWNR